VCISATNARKCTVNTSGHNKNSISCKMRQESNQFTIVSTLSFVRFQNAALMVKLHLLQHKTSASSKSHRHKIISVITMLEPIY